MKNVIYLAALLLFITSCQQNGSTNPEIGQLSHASAKIPSNVEKNLKTQLGEYNHALHGEDSNPEKVLEFIYSDTFTYLKNQHGNNYSKEMVISLFNEPVKRLKAMARENNVTYSTRVGEIVHKVNEGNKLIYTVEIFLDMEYGMEKHTTGDKILGISLDNGKIWKFLEINPNSTAQILGMKFSDNTIKKVL
ncbi:hypothetical protein JRG66_05560 [Salinimicrobium tongyeongense]|uniref:Nuclear transport factor 2 family protein n=1 Tax=Salinimicrobium tongyeongense TaxID=2809707 RepID=A0ABY6NTU1_9FLAO|nr:hypothetical protein [Salinimicrobium tongyeongense]UZH56331.1 hypothetical protein JRG66_05560 [Salinimicrobium tongyeongense]